MEFGKAIEYSNEMFAALCVTGDAVEEILVGARGFEPPTSCSQSRRATRLRHAPMMDGLNTMLLLFMQVNKCSTNDPIVFVTIQLPIYADHH